VDHACKLYQCGLLGCFLRKHAQLPWNIISLDHIELCPEVVDFLIALNWTPNKLEVKLAVTLCGEETRDVTSICRRSFVQRGCALFLADPVTDLGLSEPSISKMVVAFSIVDGHGITKHFVAEFNAQHGFPIVISPFSCGNKISIVELKQERGFKGVVHQGEVLQADVDIPDDKLSVSFTMDVSDCNFTLA